MQIRLDGTQVTGFESDKVRALLAYLVVEAAVPHSREKLAGLLWPELPEKTARARLRRALANLRLVIHDHDATPPFLHISRQKIQFNSKSDAWVDASAFAQLLDKSSPQKAIPCLEEAVTLHRGRFLEGFSLPDSAAFEEWALLQGEWFQRQVLSAIRRLAAHYEEQGDHERALHHAWHAVELEPWEEKAHQQVMRLLAYSGRRGAALAQFETCRRTLVEELGVRPSAATVHLYEQIRADELEAPLQVPTPLVPERPPQLPAFLKLRQEPDRQPFVAREHELERLEGFLQGALAGHGTVVLVSGDAGSGKTSLLAEFARRAMEEHPDLLSAWGACSAYAGTGDPYLPFREVMAMLTGDVKARWMAGAIGTEHAKRLWCSLPDVAQLLLTHGLDLIPTLVDGTALLSRAALVAPSTADWLQTLHAATERRQSRLEGMEPGYHFEQYTNVLQELAVQHPLVLILDDLQWADTSSLALLFHLGRRLEGSRILIACAYRPEELASGWDRGPLRERERHPLAEVLAEFKRLSGDTRLDLDKVGRTRRWDFLDALLETEPNRLGTDFRKKLFQHTGGHALFTVELLRAMQERGDLVRDEAGCWVSAPELDWKTFPARVEGVVEGRLGRLDADLRRILAAASVEGNEFTVQVLAGVLGMEEEELLQLLSRDLRIHYRLVQELGAAVVGDRRFFRYRFVHSLFQQYLYASLGDGERVLLHRKTAGILEEQYEGRTEEIAFNLAYHYVGDPVRERHYARLAGERAAAQFANDEALRYLNRALELTPQADAEARFSLLMTREGVHYTLGDREAQKQDLASLEKLDKAFQDEGPAAALRSAKVSLRQARYAHTCGAYPAAIAASQAALRLARTAHAPATMADAHLQWGRALSFQGQHKAARLRLEEGLELARKAGSRQVEASLLHNIGMVHYVQSEYDQAGAFYEQAISAFRELGERQNVVALLNNAGILDLDRFDYEASARQLHEALQHAREIGFRLVESIVLGNLGDCLVAWGDVATARLHQEQALRIARDTGARSYVAGALRSLSHACRLSGDLQASLQYSQQAVATTQEIGNRFFEEQALTCLGHALLALERWTEASEAHWKAFTIRQELGQRNRPVENLAGLAEAAMALGDPGQSLELVERILSHLADHSLEGCWEPARVYLICYRILRDQADSRAGDVLRAAYDFLMGLAARFEDDERRQSFLENVAVHRAILREWRTRGGASAP